MIVMGKMGGEWRERWNEVKFIGVDTCDYV
jgi:hypothetical protein